MTGQSTMAGKLRVTRYALAQGMKSSVCRSSYFRHFLENNEKMLWGGHRKLALKDIWLK